jgi:putative hydrolase of the HAD superfamily
VTPITAVISDFGGVLSSPLMHSFAAFEAESGIPMKDLGEALAAITERTGRNPVFELETGRVTEQDFLAALGQELTTRLWRPIEIGNFAEPYFAHMEANDAMIDYLRSLQACGYRMALCTNNVREWEPLWRALLPVDEIFQVVVDSGFVGVRKPDPEIYEITLDRLSVPAEEALFIDDVDINCDAARALGMTAVHFKDTDQAIAEIKAVLRRRPPVDG